VREEGNRKDKEINFQASVLITPSTSHLRICWNRNNLLYNNENAY